MYQKVKLGDKLSQMSIAKDYLGPGVCVIKRTDARSISRRDQS